MPVTLKTIWSIGLPEGSLVGEQFSIELEGEEIPVAVRRNASAKRLILRVDSHTGDIKLTLPPYVGRGAALEFLDRQSDWLLRERAAIDAGQTVEDGAILPFLGIDHTVVFTGTSPRRVVRVAGEIHVGGPKDMASKRLASWLRREAARELGECAAWHAATLGLTYNRISIGDMKSRWGSCSSAGTLRFSWRLVMAPHKVLDYVAAHEVAHLGEMNHSDRFWALVERCIPDHKTHRRWLRGEGNALFKVRFPA